MTDAQILGAIGAFAWVTTLFMVWLSGVRLAAMGDLRNEMNQIEQRNIRIVQGFQEAMALVDYGANEEAKELIDELLEREGIP